MSFDNKKTAILHKCVTLAWSSGIDLFRVRRVALELGYGWGRFSVRVKVSLIQSPTLK